ncbi:MAG: hypothetical protein ACTS8Y_04375 [Arsenophonus sp. ER-EMS1-MAG3]
MSYYCLRIIFAGTSDFSEKHLSALLNRKDKYQIVSVLTKPDKPVGRGQKITYKHYFFTSWLYF